MAKRELSSTLKNLKFMQRAVQKDEKAKKEEEVTPAGDFPSCSVARRCVVIMEGDPHPGAASGRMSFLSFNPSIDKLNEEVSGASKTESAPSSSGEQNETTSTREKSSRKHRSDDLEMDSSSNAVNGDLKRKQAEVATEVQSPNKSLKNNQGNHGSSPTSGHHSQKQQKRDKLDWSVLRPPKPQSKKGFSTKQGGLNYSSIFLNGKCFYDDCFHPR